MHRKSETFSHAGRTESQHRKVDSSDDDIIISEKELVYFVPTNGIIFHFIIYYVSNKKFRNEMKRNVVRGSTEKKGFTRIKYK